MERRSVIERLQKSTSLKVISVAFWLLAAGVLKAQEFVGISGEIVQTNYNFKHNAATEWSFPFSCIVGSNQWRIENQYPSNGRETWYYDGTNVYSCLEILPGSIAQKQVKTGVNSTDNVAITICPSPEGHPYGDPGVNLPWLAFCSGGYLKRPGRVVPVPVVDIHGDIDSFAFSDKTRTFDDAVGLPESIQLYTSRTQFLASLNNPQLFRTDHLVNARRDQIFTFADGVLRFRYWVSATTNFSGGTFPVEFHYEDYRSTDGRGNWKLIGSGAGKAISIRTASAPGNVFEQGKNQVIIDLRFRHDRKRLDAISYIWTNATPPLTNDAFLQKKYSAMLSKVGPDQLLAAAWVRYPLVALSVLPVGLLVFHLFHQRSRSTPAKIEVIKQTTKEKKYEENTR